MPVSPSPGARSTSSAVSSSLSRSYARLLRRLGHSRRFTPVIKHVLSKVDRVLIRASGGRWSVSGRQFTTMLLTTTGRTSGKDRTVPVYYVRDGRNLVVACENLGLRAASQWPKNLFADPAARIEVDGTVAAYRARLATQQEVDRNMPRLAGMWPAHDTYLQRTGTRYVFVFEPTGAAI
jgi:deazaflavin-dependent oxidoreductase (nitroreductase family)